MFLAEESMKIGKNTSPLPSEEYSRQALPPVLATSDLTAIFVVAIFFISNAGAAAFYGPTAYIYWIVGGITFFIPSVVATAQLGVLFPHEGSIYNWTNRALGPYWGFFAGVCWWFPGPLVLAAIGFTIVAYLQGLNPRWLTEPWQQGLVVIVVISLSSVVAMQPARTVQNIVNIGAILVVLAATILGVATVFWLLTGHASATNFGDLQKWSLNGDNLGAYNLIALAYLGTQVPLNMGGEIRRGLEHEGRKAITRHLLIGTLLVLYGYGASTLAPLVVVGAEHSGSPFALVATVDTVFGKFMGNVLVLCILGFFVTAAIMYNASFARLLFAASVDRRLPTQMGRLNKYRVPANAMRVQALLAISFTILSFLVVPYLVRFDNPANLSADFYNVNQATVAIVWALLTMFFYVNLIVLYRRDREAFRRKRIFPMPVIWICCVIGPIGCLVTIIDGLYFSWIPSLIPNATWLLVVAGLVLICFILAALGSMVATSEAAWQGLSQQQDQ